MFQGQDGVQVAACLPRATAASATVACATAACATATCATAPLATAAGAKAGPLGTENCQHKNMLLCVVAGLNCILKGLLKFSNLDSF